MYTSCLSWPAFATDRLPWLQFATPYRCSSPCLCPTTTTDEMSPSHKSSLGGEQGLPAEGPLRDQQSVTSSKETEQTSDHQGEAERHPRFDLSLPSSLEWVPQNFPWPKIKLVIRCSLVARVDFLVLVAAFIAPPSDSSISVLEQDPTQVFFVTIACAWSCLGIKLASFARTRIEQNAAVSAIFSGQFLDPGPTACSCPFSSESLFWPIQGADQDRGL